MPDWKDNINWSSVSIIFGGTVTVVLCVVAACIFLPWDLWKHVLGKDQSFFGAVWIWVATTIIMFILANTIFLLLRSQLPRQTIDPAMVFSTFWAIAAATLIITTLFFIRKDGDNSQVYRVLSVIGGALAGWMFGMYISPQDTSEKQEFAKIGTAVAGIASGYTLKSVEAWLTKQENATYRIYFFLAVMSAAITTATIYNVRRYGNGVKISFPIEFADSKEKQKLEVEINKSVQFEAAVTGLANTSVTWSLMPGSTAVGASIDAHAGLFKAGTTAGTCQVLGVSIGNPTMCDSVEVTVKTLAKSTTSDSNADAAKA